MDWGNVTGGELAASLQEVDWTQPPRSPNEFIANISLPDTRKKLETRLKCNLYYYRANYLLIVFAALSVSFIWRPTALLAAASGVLGSLCLNNTFAVSLSNNSLKLIRRIHSPTAQKLRSISGGHSGLGAPGRTKMEVKIIGIPRSLVVAGLDGLAFILLFRQGVLTTLLISLLAAIGLILLHAAVKVPNLKIRLASAREDFRAVWRGYQDSYQAHDLIA